MDGVNPQVEAELETTGGLVSRPVFPFPGGSSAEALAPVKCTAQPAFWSSLPAAWVQHGLSGGELPGGRLQLLSRPAWERQGSSALCHPWKQAGCGPES